MTMRKRNKLVYGVGSNDADYAVESIINGKKVYCYFYNTWRHMLARCYSDNFLLKCPTYAGCSVAEEWLTFSNFKAWMEKQDWQGKQLDKDILAPDNKHYSPDTCIFIDQATNKLLTNSGATRGKYPQGVCFHTDGKYMASCSKGNGKPKYLGLFDTPEEAAITYLNFKADVIDQVANRQDLDSVRNALMLRAAQMREQATNQYLRS